MAEDKADRPEDKDPHETEELTMDQRPPGANGPESTPTTTAPSASSTSSMSSATRHADDDAPWSVPAGTSSGTPGTAPATTTARPEIARGVRVGTIVWGLVVIVAGALLAAAAAGVVFDVQLAVIVTVALAGIALVVGSVVSAGRRRDDRT